MEWPVTSEPSRAKARPLRPRRSCFGPADAARSRGSRLVEPPGTAPGSDRFITTPVYRHSRPLRDGTVNIGAAKVDEKRARFCGPPSRRRLSARLASGARRARLCSHRSVRSLRHSLGQELRRQSSTSRWRRRAQRATSLPSSGTLASRIGSERLHAPLATVPRTVPRLLAATCREQHCVAQSHAAIRQFRAWPAGAAIADGVRCIERRCSWMTAALRTTCSRSRACGSS